MLERARHAVSKNLARTFAKVAVRRGLYAGIDRERVAEIATRHPAHMYQKYSEKLEHSCVRNAERLFLLGLDRSEPLRIFDIGSGFGYFAYGAKAFGHSVVGLDQPDPFFDEVVPEVFGIERVLHRIEAHEPLPDIPGAPFDLITAFAPCFDRPREPDQWSIPEWTSFLHDLTRFMAPGCRMYVKFNQYHVDGKLPEGVRFQPLPPELEAFFRDLGARFSKRGMDLVDAPALIAAGPGPREAGAA